jgi:hypothetical protein
MSTCESNPPAAACPPTVEDLRRQAHERLDEIIASCSNDLGPASFLEFDDAAVDVTDAGNAQTLGTHSA